jgi:hypothetical protein
MRGSLCEQASLLVSSGTISVTLSWRVVAGVAHALITAWVAARVAGENMMSDMANLYYYICCDLTQSAREASASVLAFIADIQQSCIIHGRGISCIAAISCDQIAESDQ